MTLREVLAELYLTAYEDGEEGNPTVYADMAITEALDKIKELKDGK